MESMPKAYEPKLYEEEILRRERESGLMKAESVANPSAKPFTIMMPPPNVTGTLHIGHALGTVLQDTMIRFQRMRGRRVLWLPGTDHAAIATQSKVEKIEYKATGKSRFDFGREPFLDKVRAFAQASHDTIVNQVQRMGAFTDWSREAYTLDDTRNFAVNTAFKRLYDLGLLYRGYRVVNWDVVGQTTISDDEMVPVEREATLYTFSYGANVPIVISTTRPETKVGDTAIAVHPDDERYQQYIGQTFEVEFAGAKISLRVIADKEVEKSFGTGALGVTPAHSSIDFEMKERHGLNMVQVIGEDGRMTLQAGSLVAGKTVEEARALVVEWLRTQGLMKSEETVKQNVSTAERTGGIIEPLPKMQWFISVTTPFAFKVSALRPIAGIADGQMVTLKQLMRHVVETEQVTMVPDYFHKIYFHWIDNLRDWCVSRQIWFGHRLPVWYKGDQVFVGYESPQGEGWVQDEDTLDTWFSSGLWTFSTLGWPMAEVVLMRHGEAQSNVRGIFSAGADASNTLTERGEHMVRAAAKALRGQGIARIVHSPVLRTTQTAQIVAEELGVPLQVDDRLRELGSGDFEGVEASAYKSARAVMDWLKCGPGHSEGLESMHARMREALTDVVRESVRLGGKTLVVSHGDPLATACAGTPEEKSVYLQPGEWKQVLVGNDGVVNPDFLRFHPTDVLETGRDILPFWVSRMILMTTALTGEVPFRYAYLHGMVRDEQGRKMSKSLDNIINPLDVADKYGMDAVRLSLALGVSPGNDMNLSEEKIAGFRNFVNKLWNIARFVQQTAGEGVVLEAPAPRTDADAWILCKLAETIDHVTVALDEPKFDFAGAGEYLRDFTWSAFADWYIEVAKIQREQVGMQEHTDMMLRFVLGAVIRLWHPFAPMITSTLWHLACGADGSPIETAWPAHIVFSETQKRADAFDRVQTLVTALRTVRAENKIVPQQVIHASVSGPATEDLVSYALLFERLARAQVEVKEAGQEQVNTVLLSVGLWTVGVEMTVDREVQVREAQQELERVEVYVIALQSKLANQDFLARAPAAVVAAEQDKLAQAQQKRDTLKAIIAS